MKTQSIQVALPAELAEFARQDMRLSGYGDPSEYVRDLLRKRREERIQQDVAFLQRATQSAPAENPPAAFYGRVAALQRGIRKSKKRRG